MSKLTYEDKINLYNERKQGVSMKCLSIKYGIAIHGIQYLCCLIEKHGVDILRTQRNKYYPIYIKQEAINRVIINKESIWSVALDIGLYGDGMLHTWLKKYKEMGYNIVERKRGRSPTIMKKPIQLNKKETKEEQIKRLEEENLYLKVELEYSKKLRAVVQARKNQQQKKK